MPPGTPKTPMECVPCTSSLKISNTGSGKQVIVYEKGAGLGHVIVGGGDEARMIEDAFFHIQRVYH